MYQNFGDPGYNDQRNGGYYSQQKPQGYDDDRVKYDDQKSVDISQAPS